MEGVLVVRHLGRAGEAVRDAQRREVLLELTAHDVAQGHLGGADLGADHLEPAGDRARPCPRRSIRERASEVGVLRHCRDDGHEVRLAGAVVADDQKPFVVSWACRTAAAGRPTRQAARPCGPR